MKIALIIEHFDPLHGGAEHVAFWIAHQLAQRGHEIHILCRDAKRRLPQLAATRGASHDAQKSRSAHEPELLDLPSNIHVHRIPGGKLSTGHGFRQFGRKAREWCCRNKPDLAHSFTVAWSGDIYHPEAGIYARMQRQAVASRNSSVGAAFKKILLNINGKQRMLLTLEQAAMAPWEPRTTDPQVARSSGAWRIIAISGGMVRELSQHYNFPADRMFRLNNPRIVPPGEGKGATPQEALAERHRLRAMYGLKPDDLVALFVGHDFRRKGLRWAIETIARTQKNWSLLVVGLGKIRAYHELAVQLGIESRIKFVGPTREVRSLYQAADTLLLPVFYDPAPLVVIEALSSGLPVFSTEHLGSSDLIRAHQAGTIVPQPHDATALAAALDAFPQRPTPEWQALTQRAKDAAAGVSGEAFMEQLLALYETFLRETHASVKISI